MSTRIVYLFWKFMQISVHYNNASFMYLNSIFRKVVIQMNCFTQMQLHFFVLNDTNAK